MSNKAIAALVAAVVAGASALLLIKTDSEKAVVVDTEDQKTIETKADIALPSGFPSYPEAKMENLTESVGETGHHDYSFMLKTPDSEDKIFAWYLGYFKENGWTLKSDKVVVMYRIIEAEKDNLYMTFQVAADGNQSSISQRNRVRAVAE